MGDRIAEYILGLGGDDSSLRAVFAGIKSRVRSDVAELEAITSKVELFKGAEARADAAAQAFFKARDAADGYRQEIARIEAVGGTVGQDLVKNLAASEKAAASASREYNNQSNQLAKLSSSLKKAGVDTASLATEEVRLSAAYKAATAAATEQEARQALGLKTLKDIAPEIGRLNAAYNTLRASGTLSVKDLAAAQQQLQTRTAELRGSLTSVSTAAKDSSLVSFFQRPLVHALGLTGGIAGVAVALERAVVQAHEFETAVGRIGTVTTASKAELAGLGESARALSVDLGVDLNQTIQGLFDLIRSGVPKENAIEVLRLSAEAAKASFTDVGTGVKVATLLLNSFGASVDDLPAIFDKIVRGAKDGGASLNDFAADGGKLLSVARAAGVGIDDLVATLTVLVRGSGNADQSISDLTKIIAKLNTSESREKLRALGIEGDTLADIFRQIGERGLPLEKLLGLDLSSAGAKAAGAIAALTNNSGQLPEQFERIADASGTVTKALATLLDTPKERADKFAASLQNAQTALGALFGSSSQLAQFGASILNVFSKSASLFDDNAVASQKATTVFGRMLEVYRASKPVIDESSDALKEQAAAEKASGQAAIETAAQIKRAGQELSDFSAKLAADIQAIQSASARDIADATTRADAQIAALDRSRAHEAETAAATLQIQLDLAAQRLTIIEDNERQVTAALDVEIAAREKTERDAGTDERKIASDTAAARIAALTPILQQYQAHYSALIQLAQNQSAKFQAAEQSRLDIVKSVSAAIRAVELEDLNGLDLFVEKQKHIDELISQGRLKAAQGDIAAAKQFFDQAIQESNGLTKVIDDNGVVVITALQSRTAKLDALKKISDAANESIGDQGAAAKKGADAAIAEADRVLDKIKDLQSQYDAVKRIAAEGATLRIELDRESVQTAFNTIDLLTLPRIIPLTVVVTQAGGGSPSPTTPGSPDFVGPPAPPGFKRGGIVRRLASGGPVFRFPTWSKVPGSGDGDTVPALLKAGSFVVRKSASQKYGDGIMGKLARLATGGGVGAGGGATSSAEQFYGDVGSGALHEANINIPPPQLPDDQKARERLILQYARDVMRDARSIDAGSNVFDLVVADILDDLKLYDRRPTEDLLGRILAAARAIGINLGISRGIHVGYDVDGRRWHDEGLATQSRGIGSVPGLAGLGHVYDFYARGGASKDTVPALLTPGEWVINPPAVQKLGSRFLNAINSGRIGLANLGGFLGNFAAVPPMPRFAAGGAVAGASIPSGSAVSSPAAAWTINLYGAPSDFRDQASVRRLLLPTLREFERRTRDK